MLSESVSKALTLTGGDIVTETAKFASYFDKFFDALNVKSLTEGKHKRKDYRLPYTSADDPRLDVSIIISYRQCIILLSYDCESGWRRIS